MCNTAISIVNNICVGVTLAKNSVHSPGTAACSTSCSYRDVDEADNKGEIQDDGYDGEKSTASQAAQQQNSKSCVDHSYARYSLDSADPSVNGEVVVGQCRQEV